MEQKAADNAFFLQFNLNYMFCTHGKMIQVMA